MDAGGAVELRVAVGEDAAVGGHQPVAVAARAGRHAHDGRVQVEGAGRAVELRVAVREDAAVGRHQPVAAAVGRRRHPHDGLVQMDAARRAVEVGVAEAEDAAVGGHQPVAAAVGRGGHAHDRLVEVLPAHGAEEAGVAVVEDAAVGGHEPVPVGARRVGHAHHRRVQVDAAGAAVEAGVAEVEDAAVGGDEPVAVAAVEVAAEAVVVGGRLRRDALRVADGDVHAQRGRDAGGTTVREVAVCADDAPRARRSERDRGGVGETAPDDRDGAAPADRSRVGAHRGHRRAPVRALQREGQVLVDGCAEAAGRIEADAGGEAPEVRVREVVVARRDVGEVPAAGQLAPRRAPGPTRPSGLKQP